MKIALASPRVAATLEEGLETVRRFQAEAASRGAAVVCFPEAYLPGLRGQDFEVPPYGPDDERRVLDFVSGSSHAHGVATILGMERVTDAGRQIAAAVFDRDGRLQGVQLKTQLDPSEERFYVPGTTRRLFQVDGVPFGIVICHEGWRYPETVRWAAVRGAKIVFHPQHTGTERAGAAPTRWGDPEGPYYEKAMMCRALENTIYFASVNYALRTQEAATSLITPSGSLQAHLPYGEEGILVEVVDPGQATGLLAARYAPERYPDV